MPVVRCNHSVLDPSSRQLANRAGEVVDHRVHDLVRLKREPGLACVVDLLRADDDDLSPFELPRQPRRLQAE